MADFRRRYCFTFKHLIRFSIFSLFSHLVLEHCGEQTSILTDLYLRIQTFFLSVVLLPNYAFYCSDLFSCLTVSSFVNLSKPEVRSQFQECWVDIHFIQYSLHCFTWCWIFNKEKSILYFHLSVEPKHNLYVTLVALWLGCPLGGHGSSHTSDFKMDILMVTLPDMWHYIRSGFLNVSLVWWDEIANLICNFCLSVTACKIASEDPSLIHIFKVTACKFHPHILHTTDWVFIVKLNV